jgi:hypothetical protein
LCRDESVAAADGLAGPLEDATGIRQDRPRRARAARDVLRSRAAIPMCHIRLGRRAGSGSSCWFRVTELARHATDRALRNA